MMTFSTSLSLTAGSSGSGTSSFVLYFWLFVSLPSMPLCSLEVLRISE
ncbi:hypothetical protein PAA26_05215 [Methanomassiliicoccaceae archaeon COG_1]|nr:hypothetical protein [Methanomassiliicoccaceae archaeon COG_1]